MPARVPRKRRPRGPGRLSAADAALLPDRLLDAAQAVFVETGYARATIDAVASAAGASRKTLYARYANKAELLAAVVNRLLDRALAAAPDRSAAPPARQSARQTLLHLAQELAALSAAPDVAGLNRLVFAEAARTPELARLFLDLHARAADKVEASLEALHGAGALPRLPQPRRAALLFVEMVASVPRLRALLGAPLSRQETEAMTEAAVELFLHGCGGG